MAWIFLAESEESASPLENGCAPLLSARLTPIVKECSYLECLQETFRVFPSGMISPLWMDSNLEKLSILFTADFPARISALQEMEKAWQESEADYFTRSSVCVAKLSQDSSFWKTFQPLLPEEEQKWYGKLPRWGMIVDGALYPLHPLEQCTKGKDGSYWPTPDASDSTRGPTKVYNPKSKSQSGRTITSFAGGRLNPHWIEKVMGYPSKWTELEDSVIQWYRLRPKKRSKF